MQQICLQYIVSKVTGFFSQFVTNYASKIIIYFNNMRKALRMCTGALNHYISFLCVLMAWYIVTVDVHVHA